MNALLRRARGLALLARPDAVEAALWRKVRHEADVESRTQLFEHYAAWARSVARREWRRRPAYGLERADFEHFAIAGLLQAMDRFDPLGGHSFEGFARPRIRGAISDGIAASSEAAAQYTFRRRLERERLSSLREGASEGDAIARLSGIVAGLAIGLIVEDASEVLQSLPSPEPDAYESRAWREMQRNLMAALAAMKEPDRTIVHQHYVNGLEFAEIAELLKLSRARISQIHRSALMALRLQLRYDV